MALFDAFLKIEGIEGESPDAKHKGEIQLESFSWSESQTSKRPFRLSSAEREPAASCTR